MRLKQSQPRIFNHIVSSHLRKVRVRMPRVKPSSPKSVLKKCHTSQATDHQVDHHDANHGFARPG
jgi:hypothetical protein